jgi:hypothetical protein
VAIAFRMSFTASDPDKDFAASFAFCVVPEGLVVFEYLCPVSGLLEPVDTYEQITEDSEAEVARLLMS